MVPERVPVGAIFGIKAPDDAGVGIWGKEGSFLSGKNGTYIPLKAGKTVLTYTTVKYRFTLYLDIVDDSLPEGGVPADGAPAGTETPPAETPPAEGSPASPPASGVPGVVLGSMVPRGSIVLY
jgi:hypothetical protein